MHAQRSHIIIRPLSLLCLFILVIAVAALFLSCELSRAQKNNPTATKPTYYLATGTPNGAYVRLGAAIKNASKDIGQEVNIIPCTTGGSTENLQLLRENKVQFAIVQMDSLHGALHDEEHEAGSVADTSPVEPAESAVEHKREPERDISLVSYLYSEKLHVFVRPHLYLSSPGELNGIADKSRVWLGPSESGTYKTALRVLEASGLSESDIGSFESANKAMAKRNEAVQDRSAAPAFKMDWDVAAKRIQQASRSEGLDAYFRMMAVPRTQEKQSLPAPRLEPCTAAKHKEPSAHSTPAVLTDTLLENDVRLIGLPQNVIDHMTEDKLYVPTTIELGSYRNLKRGVATIGVAGVLVTNLPKEGAQSVADLIDAMASNKSAIESEIGGIELDQFNTTVSEGELRGHIHEGAQAHLLPSTHCGIWWCSSVLALGMFAAVIVRNPAQTRRLVARASYVFLLVGILSGIFVVTSIMMMHSEGRLNPDFSSFLNSISNTLKFVVGLKRDYRPMTQEGNTYLWAAVFLFPMVFGWLTSDVVKAFLRKISAQLEQMIANWQPADAFPWIFRLPLILAGMVLWKKPRDAAAG